jgi:hypothetical protein
MNNEAIIIGAGLSGLIAACMIEGRIFEAADEPKGHKALLRFRSDIVSQITGIPFKKVNVQKGIWSNGQFKQPSIGLLNAYSYKVTGEILPRSIINIDPVVRYIAPENFHQQLLKRHLSRICFNASLDGLNNRVITINLDNQPHTPIERNGNPIISTIPITIMNNITYQTEETSELSYSNITTFRYRLDHCDTYQTIYFPDINMNVYRASITGSLLIIESLSDAIAVDELEIINKAFGLNYIDAVFIDKTPSRFGKIKPNERITHPIVYKLTRDYNVFSLGRFALWRNILLDDVVADMNKILKLMWLSDYEVVKGHLIDEEV